MKGQWTGKFLTFESSRFQHFGKQVMMNVDEIAGRYSAVLYISFDDFAGIPDLVLLVDFTEDYQLNAQTKLILPVAKGNGRTADKDELRMAFPSLYVPDSAEINGEWTESKVQLEIHLKIEGVEDELLSVFLVRTLDVVTYDLEEERMDWSEFRHAISELNWKKPVFRGQSEPWKLMTAFHRRERFDVSRFQWQDLPALHRHLSSRTRHIFDLKDPAQKGAFINLVQHHGYPTPFLDWSYSPYVAAFFAFNGTRMGAKTEHEDEKYVRIFLFNIEQWTKTTFQSPDYLETAYPHLSFAEYPAIENPRAIPQQSITLSTNVHDLEGYIKTQENLSNTQYLRVIDIPWSEQRKALKDLEFMGLTAGALFPGLDGACSDVMSRFF